MSLKKWKNQFTKREFIKLVRAVVRKNMNEFDYTRRPCVFEDKLPENALMSFYGRGKITAVVYDYTKFKRRYGKLGYYEQYVSVVQSVAHEMRHYYQHRQITANNPVESQETLNDWKENKVVKTSAINKTNDYKYWFSARELDANLYSYVFTLDNLDAACLNSICNKEHFVALKKLYKRQGGKNVKKYFSNKIKKMVD